MAGRKPAGRFPRLDGDAVRARREELGLTRDHLAARIRFVGGALSVPRLVKIEAGETTASHPDTLRALAKVLRCRQRDLVTS